MNNAIITYIIMLVRNSQNKQKNLWISITGYRIFLEFMSLLSSPKSLNELCEIVKNDSHINKEISKDTIRCDINTLKAGGCVISKPSKSNNFKYQIISHPFKLNISKEELNVFLVNVP